MDTVSVFIQGAGVRDVRFGELLVNSTFEQIRKVIAEKAPELSDLEHVFYEGSDEPLENNCELECDGDAVYLHVSRCLRIDVTVNFNGQHFERKFSPATTIARLKRWATKQAGISKEDAAEYALQISGTDERPDAETHLGALLDCSTCNIEFDLVPTDRING